MNATPNNLTKNTDINTTLQNNGKILSLIYQALQAIETALTTAFPEPVNGSAGWTPGAVTANSQVTTTVNVTGAALGDFVLVSSSVNLQGQQLTGYVSAANTVTVVLRNGTAGTITLGAITVNARVFTT